MPEELEASIEKRFRKWVEDQGGIWVKLLADGRKGIPDCLVLMPPITVNGVDFPVHAIIELKRSHGTVSRFQEKWISDLSKISQPAFIAYSFDHAVEVVEHVTESLHRRLTRAMPES